jgi:hypothetical protein
MRLLLVLAGLAVSLAASGQEIYRWVDKDGIVHYADQPGSPDAVLINIIEPNAYDSADTATAAPYAGDADEESEPEDAYQSLAIVSPENDQVYFGADAVVLVSAYLEGTLQPDHSIALFMNGKRLDASGPTAELSELARGSYTLGASVLDANGKPVISSRPVSFHVRQPSINSPQSPQAPTKPGTPVQPTPRPGTLPKPPPKPPTPLSNSPGR